jgi:gliding motility-associated-like protein
MEAIVTQQPDLSSFVSYCEGLTIAFENESYGGTNYAWDFGVPGITTDVSSDFAPVYTFPAPGTYDVMLVVNPGWSCTDTSWGTFILNNEIEATFEPPPAQCIIGNSYDFTGDGIFPSSGTTFLWDFGPNATPATSTDQNPTGIVFSTPGPQNVSFQVFYDVCATSHNDVVLVAAPPSVNFGIADEIKCVPYTAEFVNLSTASTQIFSFWDFGDGTTSTDTHPVHVYTDVGVYDVTLTIWTTSGCIDTLTMFRPNLIEVFPRPTSQFSVTPPEANEYEADFFFTDESIDGVEQWFYFADGSFSPFDSVWHTYLEPGIYFPYQIVYNEFGCSDRSQEKIVVTPVMPVIVPNAFTPNGDSFNQIFQPVMYEDQVYELMIFNRWGEMVHYAKELNANWDGTYNGVLCEDGIYVWKIIYTSFKHDNIPVEVNGHVMLMK